MMESLVCLKPGELEYRHMTAPQLAKGQAIIKIKRVGVCGTDLHAFEGTQPYFSYPRILGHELSGDLIDADGAPGFVPGEKVTIIPYFNCGHCIACRNGKPNCCVQINVCGVHSDGALTEYLSVPSYSLLHSQGLGYEELALVEPLAIGAHGIRRAAVQPDEFVLVVGAGAIGLGTMEFARIAGGRVIALDVNNERLQFCKDRLQIPHVIHARDEDVPARIDEITGGDGCTVVIDATGNLGAINHALRYLSHGGRYVLIGLQKEPFSFSHPEFHKRESTLMSSRNATREDFQLVMRAIKAGHVQPETYITHHVPFHEVSHSFSSWLPPAAGIIKVMITL